MKFFIDTANLAQIREANEMGVLDGVTTNPSLMAKENIRGEEACRRHYLEICSIVDGDVSAEVIATDSVSYTHLRAHETKAKRWRPCTRISWSNSRVRPTVFVP